MLRRQLIFVNKEMEQRLLAKSLGNKLRIVVVKHVGLWVDLSLRSCNFVRG